MFSFICLFDNKGREVELTVSGLISRLCRLKKTLLHSYRQLMDSLCNHCLTRNCTVPLAPKLQLDF